MKTDLDKKHNIYISQIMGKLREYVFISPDGRIIETGNNKLDYILNIAYNYNAAIHVINQTEFEKLKNKIL